VCERSFRLLPDIPEELPKLPRGISTDPISFDSLMGFSSDIAEMNSL
jgi:hypothetical protein